MKGRMGEEELREMRDHGGSRELCENKKEEEGGGG